jgi:hypothetical protein
MPRSAAAGVGDVVVTGQSVAADGEVAQGGHGRGPVVGTDLGQVLAEGDIADPVQRLDPPVPTQGVGDQVRPGLGARAGW